MNDAPDLARFSLRDIRQVALEQGGPMWDHSAGNPLTIVQPMLGGSTNAFPFRSDAYLFLLRLQNHILLPGGLVTDGKGALYAHGITYHLRPDRSDLGIVEYTGDDKPITLKMPPKRRKIAGPAIGLIGSTNFGHFLFEFLPRLYPLTFSREVDGLPVILRKGVPARFLDYLEMVGITRDRIVWQEDDEALEVEHLWMPSTPFGRTTKGQLVFSPSALAYLRSVFSTPFRRPAGAPRPRVYLDRKGATFRRLANEADILPLIEKRGFALMDSMGLSTREQLEIIANAEAVFSQVGSSPTITMFAPQDARILELFPPAVAGMFVGIAYAAMMGQPYHRVIGERVSLPDNSRADPLWADYKVDPAVVSAALDAMQLR